MTKGKQNDIPPHPALSLQGRGEEWAATQGRPYGDYDRQDSGRTSMFRSLILRWRWLRSTLRSSAATSIARSRDRKSTRLNSSHGYISYAVFCLKKKTIV